MLERRAVVLLSGGLDSTTVAWQVKQQGFQLFALSFRYGQRHRAELEAAALIAAKLEVEEHLVIDFDLRKMGGSALTDDIPVPRNGEISADQIPVTYVPARNTIFLSFALAWAEVLSASDIFIGANALDYSGYPDCRPGYLRAFEEMANLATVAGVTGTASFRIVAPLLDLTKAQIVALGHSLGVDYSLTHSCYDPGPAGLACGGCDSCVLRLRGFAEAGCTDPIRYQT